MRPTDYIGYIVGLGRRVGYGLLVCSIAACASAGEMDPDNPPAQGPDGGNEPPPDAGFDPRPDARVELPDAAPQADAAPPCMDTTVQLLTNPGLDLGPGGGWIEAPGQGGYPIITTPGGSPALPVTPQNGSYAIWLGGVYDSMDGIYQDVALPADATSVVLNGYRLLQTYETNPQPYDWVSIEIRNPQTNVAERTLTQWNNVEAVGQWTSFSFPVGDEYAGQTIRVYLESQTDGSLHTNFYFDSFELLADTCQ